MDDRLSDDPTGRVFAWKELSQAELDQIAHDSHKQRQARLMKDPPKCSYCPNARFTSLTMFRTHCQSKAHRIRVRGIQKTQKKGFQTSSARTFTNTYDPSGTDGQSSSDSLDGKGTRALICDDADKGVESADHRGSRLEPPDLGESRERKKLDSGRLQAKKTETAATGQTSDPQERNLKGTNANPKKNPVCPLCHGSTLRKHSLRSHLLSAKHMKAVRKFMQTWSGPIPPSSETDVLSAMDPYCWGAAVGAEEERDEEAEEDEEEDEEEIDIDMLPASLEGDSYDSLSAQEVDMDLSE